LIHPVFVERRMQNAPRAIAVTSGSRKSGVIASRWCGGGPVRLISLLLCYHTHCLGASTRMGYLLPDAHKTKELSGSDYVLYLYNAKPPSWVAVPLPHMTIPNLPTNTGGAGAQTLAGGLGVPPNLLLLFLSPLPRVEGVGGGSSLANMPGCSTPSLNTYYGGVIGATSVNIIE